MLEFRGCTHKVLAALAVHSQLPLLKAGQIIDHIARQYCTLNVSPDLLLSWLAVLKTNSEDKLSKPGFSEANLNSRSTANQ